MSSNVETGALVTLTAASAGGNSADLSNTDWRGVNVVVNVTAITGTTPTLTVSIQGKDPVSGQYYTLLTNATAISANGTYLFALYPGGPTSTTSPSFSSPAPLPRTWRILYTIGGTTPAVTATMGASYIL